VSTRRGPDDDGSDRRIAWLPAVLALTDAVLLLLSVGVWLTRQVPLEDLTGAYLLGDAAIGAGFAAGGALVTLRARRNVVGWLMLVAGTLYLVATAVGSLLYLRLAAGDAGPGSRALAAVFGTVWMPGIALCIPLAVQLFPTGRPANRFWAVILALSVAGGTVASLSWFLSPDLMHGMGLDDDGPLLAGGPPAWLDRVLDVLAPTAAAMALALLAPFFRLLRRPGEERLQVLWLVWASVVVAVVNAPSGLADVPPPVPLLVIPLIPLAMTAAILRYRLYGITLVINRTAVYLALTVTLLGGYLALVYGLARLVPASGVREVLGAGAIAVAFSPLRALLQRTVDRLMFGPGADAYGVLAELGHRLQSPMTPDQVLPAIAGTVAGALALPYVLVRAGRPGGEPTRTVEVGTPTGPTTEFPLTHRGEPVGTLVVGTGGRPRGLGGPRRGLLADLVHQAGSAVHSVLLTEELTASRQRTIDALEEERIRIRRDLHDGLGPTLTGVLLKAEAAGNVVDRDAGRARALLSDVAEQTQSAIDDVRRLVYGLHPPSLARLGLGAALQGYVDRLGSDSPQLELELPADLPRIAPPVEVAAYRIVTEALANVVRHSSADHACARLWVEDGSLHLEVADDGTSGGAWTPGVGLSSMRERTEEMGGGFAAAGSNRGGRVSAWLPLAPA
jgi:signal transduction histidine kinase